MSRRLALGVLAAAVALAPASRADAQARAGRVVVIARLLDAGPTVPHCGTLHVGVLMRYEVVRVVSGRLAERQILVAVGCPTMPRATYGHDAGTLASFRVGDVHRLVVSATPPRFAPSVVYPSAGPPPSHLWLVRADAAAP